jgi:hypothetical protein
LKLTESVPDVAVVPDVSKVSSVKIPIDHAGSGCSHSACSVMLRTSFGFNRAVEFLFTFFQGESHGRFIPVISE